MGLTSLPTELLLEILSQVRRRDLKKLCEVSKSFYNFTVPILYKSVGLEVEDEYSMEEVNMELLLRPRRQPQDVLHFTEDFFIAASFHSLIEQRCWNYWGSKPLERTTNNSDDDGDYIENMAKKLIYVLERFKDGQLRSFSWELGVCIPARLLGDSGYLTIRQNRVEAIRLITDSSCGHEFHDPPALKSFQALKNLSWVGLCMQDEFEALRDTLIQRSDQLQELELDLIDWYGAVNNAWDDEVSENFFGEHVLGISYDDTRCILPSLRVLSLSEIAFHPFEKEIACAFGSSRLRSLKLRFCYGWEGFLAHMKDLNSQIGIKSLEVQYSSKYECDAYEYPTYDGEHPLLAFIRAFDGLEELFISTGTPSNTLDIWKAALSHKSTLKRLVHHQREFNADVEFADFLGDGNSKNFSLDSGDPRMLMQDPLRYPLASFNLECFGICCEPKYLRHVIAPLATNSLAKKSQLQVLHIRVSGSIQYRTTNPAVREHLPLINDDGEQFPKITKQLREFAEWIFGPDGFPSLKVLAAGDFSYDGRFSETNAILCRKEESATTKGPSGTYYRHMRDSDKILRSILDGYYNVLEACPAESIYRQ